MKIRLSLFCIALALIATNLADAQGVGPLDGGGFAQSGFQNVRGDLLHTTGRPGRVWFEANGASGGLGYTSSYGTLGFKTRIGEDRFDGRWLVEGRGHYSFVENGDGFLNIGIERVFSIEPAQADVSVSVWYDFNGKDQNLFTHTFHQVGVTGQLKKENWDFILNGYMPTGVQDNVYGDLSGANCFVDHNIVIRPGIDSALQGFDATLRLRPKRFSFVNGYVDVGGYHYNSDVIDAFAGVKLRTGFQLPKGAIVSVEINNDERFNTTGVVSLGWLFGANESGFGQEYSPLGRDLEQTSRNDHIVRYNQDYVLALDPDTGRAYNVVHADNEADPTLGVGTAELPFATLAAAEGASVPGDIIYVDGGDGTDRNYSDGITLKNDQYLLGSGGRQFIPIQDGLLFELCKRGPIATISNSGGNEVVRLANNNVVGGLNIAAAGASFGIFGPGGNIDGEIRNNTIAGATLDGIGLTAARGDWDFSGNRISGNGRDGIWVNGNTDTTSTFNFEDNIANSNGFDGIHLENYRGPRVTATRNTTNSNGRHGLFIKNGMVTGKDIDILSHTSSANGGDGVNVTRGDGNLRFLNGLITGNTASGLRIENWSDTLAGDATTIGASVGSTAVFTGNGTGITLDLNGPGLVQDVLVTSSVINGNGRGLFADVEGIGTIMNLSVLENISISSNDTEGIRLQVDNSGVINNLIENTGAALPLVNNNINSGGTITYVLGGVNGQAFSEINSIVRNVNINTAAGLNKIGINVEEVENSRIYLDVADSTITAALGINISLDNGSQGLINTTLFDNLVLRADLPVLGQSMDGTLWDFSLKNSNLQSNGILAAPGEVLDPNFPELYTPYLDAQGDNGIVILADGGGVPGSLFDNLTRVNLQNNVIRDFTFEGVILNTTGDAQMLAYVQSNQIFNNGPGLNDDPNGDGVFEGPNSNIPNPNEFFFHDGLVIRADDISTISARINDNAFNNNFERGITLQTVGSGTINAVMNNNRLSNDIGLNDTPGPPSGANIFDLDVINDASGSICLGMSNNTFRLLPVNWVQIGAATPATFQAGLDGASNGFSAADLPPFVGSVGFGLCEGLVTSEELFFATPTAGPPSNPGFPDPGH